MVISTAVSASQFERRGAGKRDLISVACIHGALPNARDSIEPSVSFCPIRRVLPCRAQLRAVSPSAQFGLTRRRARAGGGRCTPRRRVRSVTGIRRAPPSAGGSLRHARRRVACRGRGPRGPGGWLVERARRDRSLGARRFAGESRLRHRQRDARRAKAGAGVPRRAVVGGADVRRRQPPGATGAARHPRRGAARRHPRAA